MKSGVIVFFTRVPSAGGAKTRLLPLLTPEQCRVLQNAFIRDIFATLNATSRKVVVCYTPPGEEEALKKALGADARPHALLPQRGASLGRKMHNAICDVLEQGHEACLLLGSDIPLLSAEAVEAGFRQLEGHDVFLSPTEDGGYCMIGMKKPHPELFEMEYGGSSVYDATKRKAEELGLRCAVGAMQWDVDEPQDLLRLKELLEREAAPPCPQTRQALADMLRTGRFGR